MGLEVVTFIEDLNSAWPVGSTDFVSQGDDHIRNIKKAVQGSFPSLGAVAVALTAAQINDAALKSATQTVSGAWTFSTAPTMAGTNITGLNASNLSTGTVPDARFPATLPALSGVNLTALNASNLASGTVADGRLSSNVPLKNAANGFTATQTVTVGDNEVDVYAKAATGQLKIHGYHSVFGGPFLQARNAADSAYVPLQISAGKVVLSATGEATVESGLIVGAPTGGDKGVGTINAQVAQYVAGVRIESLPMISSNSTTLAKGQVHLITGDATLPALAAGEWIAIINASTPDITITRPTAHGMFWGVIGYTGSTLQTVTLGGFAMLVAVGIGSSDVVVNGNVKSYTT